MASRYTSRLVRAVYSRTSDCGARKRNFATAKADQPALFNALDTFSERHIGPDDQEVSAMLKALGYNSMESFVNETVPPAIRVSESSISNKTITGLSERELYVRARELADKNKPFKSYIGMGYHNAVVPPVILRNVRSSAQARLYGHKRNFRSWKIRLGTPRTPPISQK